MNEFNLHTGVTGDKTQAQNRFIEKEAECILN